ncbi:hypothetical protein BIW11_05125 [Tropilaelaps mercedesae]|uniref:Uncharacterized protein n=1 Tax=Tropilaelaps mercedesae TaxID=418985 RepID=A0A1V9Y3P1_9ACAR|nr:hypothetical protein BIW11_05125 [Tropilaelaps mercedesae]
MASRTSNDKARLANYLDTPDNDMDLITPADPHAGHGGRAEGYTSLADANSTEQDDQTNLPLKRPLSVTVLKEIELTERYRRAFVARKYLLEIVLMLYIFPTTLLTTPMTELFVQKVHLRK